MKRRQISLLFAVFFILCAVFFYAQNKPEASQPTNTDAHHTISSVQNNPAQSLVYITETGEKYHRRNCRYLFRSKLKISLEEAVEKGYVPCSVCMPAHK